MNISELTNFELMQIEQCLNREVKRNRKGRFLLIYSDLAENLGIQEKGRI